MKLLKPDWVHHDEKPIFSVDVHPDGTKFATGGSGQGTDSGRVVIWNLEPILSEAAGKDKLLPKLLCQLDNHLACVNCVRWSHNGVMLASAGDDKIIMIWKRGKGPTALFGNGGITKTTESWRCVSTLRGHSGDVLDVAWSPQDNWLASCSVDNNIIIWNMNNLPNIVAILKGHTGLVKGVTWDPVGKYVASQSDDKSVRIWKTSDWTCQSKIIEPFEECGGTTHILRLSWSPDGLYLVSAHAMNGGGPTAQIIDREGWKCDKDFVGHRKAVTCVRFHNSILKRNAPKTNKSQQYCCLAVGSRDRSLSVWMTALQRPLVVIHELFEDSILDMSWSTDKNILLACSTDGTIACLIFTEDELGKPLSEENKNSLYLRMYGKTADVCANTQTGKDMIVEYPELLNVNNNTSVSKQGTVIEIDNNDTRMSTDKIDTVNLFSNNALQSNSSPIRTINKQIETRTADGKRRITPVFIPLVDQDLHSLTHEMSSSSRQSSDIIVEKSDIQNMPVKQPIHKIESNRELETVHVNKNSQLDTRLTKKSQAPVPSQTMVKLKDKDVISLDKQLNDSNTATVVNDSFPNVIKLTSGKAIPLQGICTRSSIENCVQIYNASISTTFGKLCKLSCYQIKNQISPIWETFIGSPVVNFCVCLKYVLVCCTDGTIRFFDIKHGVLILPIIKLPSAGVQCAFSINSRLGGIISECGIVRVWNISEQILFLTTSCTDLLINGIYVAQFYITEKGMAIILMSNGTSYTFSKQLESWLVLNSMDPLIRYGLSATTANSSKNMKLHPLGSVQASVFNYQSIVRNVTDVSSNLWQNSAKLSFIENQIELAKSLNSPVELEYWYTLLGTHLAIHGTEKRVRNLLDALLRPHQNREILGISKHILLNKILDQLKLEPQWQRIFMEYSEQLNDVRNVNSNGMDIF